MQKVQASCKIKTRPLQSSEILTLSRIIHRKNSWSRLKILVEMFRFICFKLQIDPQFLDVVFGFCYRTASHDRTFMCLYKSVISKDELLDIGYNLRFFEPNGDTRKGADPWSCRQSAVYQKLFPLTSRSVWMVIQPPLSFPGSLHDHRFGNGAHPLALHIRYIRACMLHWRDYINQKDSELLIITGKLSSTRPLNQFEVDFFTLQKIIALRKKLYLALTIVDGNTKIISDLTSYAAAVSQTLRLDSLLCQSLTVKFGQVIAEMETYKSAVKMLLSLTEDLSVANQNVLALRNQELLINNGALLMELGRAAASDNRALSKMTDNTMKDSRTMRIATVVAMFYLPANIVMSFFSTGLVEFYPRAKTTGISAKVDMIVHNQVWIAIFFSLLLAIVTVALLVIWDRYSFSSSTVIGAGCSLSRAWLGSSLSRIGRSNDAWNTL
ncbi:MAG: hypothetical protein M1839_000657 [Geoglossum umbratile]|nr:MAG: hypothetical protein M1839_000657 [Geoglossum umbratile]